MAQEKESAKDQETKTPADAKKDELKDKDLEKATGGAFDNFQWLEK